jgi:hypothetical protein
VTITDRPPAPETETRETLLPGRSNLPVAQLVSGGVLLLIGVLWLLERVGVVDVSVTAVLGLATMVVGVSLMLLAGRGSHGGLITLGAILALVTLVTAVAPTEGFQGGVGDRAVVVSTVDDIRPDYNLAMGTLTIDLRDVDAFGAPTVLTASVGIGKLSVLVPEGTEVAVDALVGAGETVIFGRQTDGVGIEEHYETPGFAQRSGGLVLELEVFTGRVEVTDG